MKDFRAISKNYFGKVKSGFGFKTDFGKIFKEYDVARYTKMFDSRPETHKQLVSFLESKKDIKTVAEIGCSIGLYPTRFVDVFNKLQYTGFDISESSINYCKEHSKFEFICTDFLKDPISRKYDFVFSVGVIDHVYDIDLFIRKIVELTDKYAYINSYRGYFPKLEKHKMSWVDADGVYYNYISAVQARNVLLDCDLSEDQFEIIPSPSGNSNNDIETVIRITKNDN